jgi:hypothetical protein
VPSGTGASSGTGRAGSFDQHSARLTVEPRIHCGRNLISYRERIRLQIITDPGQIHSVRTELSKYRMAVESLVMKAPTRLKFAARMVTDDAELVTLALVATWLLVLLWAKTGIELATGTAPARNT